MIQSVPTFRTAGAVRELRTSLTLIGQSGNEQREGLGVAGDPEGSGVHRIEAHVANQPGDHDLGAQKELQTAILSPVSGIASTVGGRIGGESGVVRRVVRERIVSGL